jgi:SecD/SecF fusion protein
MLIGIGFGTYSSIFIASAIAYDFLKKEKKKKYGKSTSNKEVLASK